MYQKELLALKKSHRYRKREIFHNLKDLASNDYLGLAYKKKQLKKACKNLAKEEYFTPKASMLVNGYHPIHQKFETFLAKINGFEAGLVVGSGFLANIALIEALVRKNDILFIDSEFHASGNLAAKLVNNVTIFEHNNVKELEYLLQESKAKRKIIAIEGVYSMSGDLAKKEIFDLAKKYEAILIVDEAHSSGTIGKNLLGIFDYYHLKIEPNFIKMGTLGKAYGSYGAYILSSSIIREFLINRAKPIIYSTAPSLFDIELAYLNAKYILNHKKKLQKKVHKLKKVVFEILGFLPESLIVPIEIGNNKKVLAIQKALLKKGYLVGAIREPTVKRAIVRVILRKSIKPKELKFVLEFIKNYD